MTRCSPAATRSSASPATRSGPRGRQPQIAWHAWEPTLERPPAAAFEGVDGVVHLLGEKIDQRWTDEAKQKIMESRSTGTHNLVGAIAGLERKPRVLVSQSAVGYYGDRGDEPRRRVERAGRRASTPR